MQGPSSTIRINSAPLRCKSSTPSPPIPTAHTTKHRGRSHPQPESGLALFTLSPQARAGG
eukprot:8811683-Pyramimonas_sp.AAC.1